MLPPPMELQVPDAAFLHEEHFPGAPCVPGSCLLEAVRRAARQAFGHPVICMEQARFRHFVPPGSVCRLLWDRYHLPLLITENGFGNKETPGEDGTVIDDDRIDYLSRHLLSVKKALNVGVNVFGYCSWSFMDIVSGHSGFSKRYGLVRVNREEHDLKDLARSKKKSFYWYKKTIAENGENIAENASQDI